VTFVPIATEQELFERLADGRTRVVRESSTLEHVNEALNEQENGEVEARLVFDLRWQWD
jgi:D-arabinose 1-dehydrogenase-like Zn-dependent alcohol dehydrogenase